MKTRLWQPCRNKIVVVGVLGLAPCHCSKSQKAGTSMSIPIDITDDTLASSLVPVQCASLAPPAEVLRLFRRYTLTHTHPRAHTHTRPEPGLKGKRKRKSGHKRRAKGQDSARRGRKQTDLKNQPIHGETDLTNTEHSPKPHDTLQRGTGEKLGTEWGTS